MSITAETVFIRFYRNFQTCATLIELSAYLVSQVLVLLEERGRGSVMILVQ